MQAMLLWWVIGSEAMMINDEKQLKDFYFFIYLFLFFFILFHFIPLGTYTYMFRLTQRPS